MNDKKLTFKKVLQRCENALKLQPEMFPLNGIISDLNFVIQWDLNIHSDFERLEKINIGWVAVREMDGYEDHTLIESLCLISKDIDQMKIEARKFNENN